MMQSPGTFIPLSSSGARGNGHREALIYRQKTPGKKKKKRKKRLMPELLRQYQCRND